MTVLGILKAVLSLASFLAEYARDKQLMDAGAAKALLEHSNSALEKVNAAINARRAVSDAPADIVRDPDNRDRR